MATYNGVRYNRALLKVLRASALYRAGKYLTEHADEVVAAEYGYYPDHTDAGVFAGEVQAEGLRMMDRAKKLYPDVDKYEEGA